MTNQILQGDCLEVLKTIPDEAINCAVTSPPYYGLRDYGVKEQIGLEETPEQYINKLVAVFRELRRVLKNDGVLWLNIGDSYNQRDLNRTGENGFTDGRKNRDKRFRAGGLDNCKPKDLIGIPWMLAFALRADGWYLRQDIIWNKPNPMPESVTDRCTKAHEYIFLLTKSAKYFYDADATKEPVAISSRSRLEQDIKNQSGSNRVPGKTNGSMKAVGDLENRNKRSVWTITTKPYSEAHFATFPIDLPITCIKAGCPEDGIVIDPFAGAGTTLLAAWKLERKYIGIELNQEYIEIADKRLKLEQAQMDLFRNR